MAAQNFTQIMATLVVLGQISILVSIVGYFLYKKSDKQNIVTNFLNQHAFLFSFWVALISMLGSLIYSDYFGYEPCLLCWYQRIFMYPQVILFFVAIIRKDKTAFIYPIILSIFGALIAFYHYLLQIGAVEIAPCTTVGYSVSCADKFVMTFGYITIPMMALTGFLMIITNTVIWSKLQKVK